MNMVEKGEGEFRGVPRIGEEAPDFALTNAKGEVVQLSDFRGQPVVLYFYPKDMTPGCTKEACGFRDYFTYFEDKKVVILGVSMDSEASHQKFIEKYALPFQLLSDSDGRVARLYGAYQKKESFGKEYWGIKRMTFVIDPQGIVQNVFDRMSVEDHHRDVLHLFE